MTGDVAESVEILYRARVGGENLEFLAGVERLQRLLGPQYRQGAGEALDVEMMAHRHVPYSSTIAPLPARSGVFFLAPNISKGECTLMENIDATAFRALANQRRLAVLALLGRDERSVGKLQRLIGIGQSAVSQHLARLRAARLVRRRRDGQTI